MALKLMYITNNVEVARIAQKYGIERIWVDLETLGKNERQGHIDSVKSHHSISDIKRIVPILDKSEMLVRVNPINESSEEEINQVIDAGADIIMLPMWKSKNEVISFLKYVNGKTKTVLLLETKEAVECLDDVLNMGGFDEIHIGLNDLHLSYGQVFMFQLLTDGTIENLCNKIKKYNIPYGFGGIAKLGTGDLPAENVIQEHYRLGSTRAILSRSFCNVDNFNSIEDIDNVFFENIEKLRKYEESLKNNTINDYLANEILVKKMVEKIVSSKIGEAK